MAQADQTIQNDTFPAVRADLNNNLLALFTNNSGSGEPTVRVAYMDWIDTSGANPVWKKRNATNTAWVTVAEFIGGELQIGGVPAGAVSYFLTDAAPFGWLKANGAAVSRSTYSGLFAAIGTYYGVGNGSTTFNLPDLRGEFLRSLDDGRGVDTGRSRGTFQSQSFESHGHSVSHNAQRWFGSRSTSNFTSTFIGADVTIGHTDASVSVNAAGGVETRPRNIALLACVKY